MLSFWLKKNMASYGYLSPTFESQMVSGTKQVTSMYKVAFFLPKE